MRKTSYKKYLFFGALLFGLLSLSPLFVDALRTRTASALRPFWARLSRLDRRLHKKEEFVKERQKLEGENHLLRLELRRLAAIVEQQAHKLYAEAVPAEVIYRDPENWGCSLWVNVGAETTPSVVKNSPVVVGKGLVGVIDYVGATESRVRLISDPHLKLSVRALRGAPQNAVLQERIDALLSSLEKRKDLPLSADETTRLVQALKGVSGRLDKTLDGWYLAKGVLEGSGAPLWRSRSQVLKGIGFNYDYPDAEGPARPLHTGIIQVGDLLITTGMDGVFPKGLRVAEVSKVFPLREGGYCFTIEATPIVGTLDELETVFVLPPCEISSLPLKQGL